MSDEPPRISRVALGYSYTLSNWPNTVVMTKATNGQPPQRIQRGIGYCKPRRLMSSVSEPSGQNTPHHTRPMSIIDTITNGHHTPQNATCARRVRLSYMCAESGGNGRNAGIITSAK